MSREEHSRMHKFFRPWTKKEKIKSFNSRMKKYGPGNNRTPESYKKQWDTKREKYGETGCNPGKRFCGTSESMKKTWKTRRERYGENGRKNKRTKNT